MRNTRVVYTTGLPPLRPATRNLLIAVTVLFVVELLARNWGFAVAALEWQPLGRGFQVWQLATHPLVMGRDTMGFLFSALVLYFFWDPLGQLFSPMQLRQAAACGVALGLGLPFALDAAHLLPAHLPAMGWDPVATAMVVLFGLGAPRQEIRLFFVLPITASWFVWFTLVIALLVALMGRSLPAWEHLGVVLGVLAWHRYWGPGRRRRELLREAERVERELRRFTVLEGGRSNRPPDGDDWVH